MIAPNEAIRRLEALANDCEEYARKAPIGSDARSDYHTIAAEARSIARARHMGDDVLRLALVAFTYRVIFTATLNGDMPPDSVRDSLEGLGGIGGPLTPAKPVNDSSEAPRAPVGVLLNARQLADRFTMSENGARDAIKRGYRRGVEGFHRDGALWLAEPDAFARSRGQCGIGEGPQPAANPSTHDGTYPTSPPEAGRTQA